MVAVRLRAAVTRLEPCEEHQRCTSNFAWIFEDGWLARIVGRNELADALEAAQRIAAVARRPRIAEHNSASRPPRKTEIDATGGTA